MANKWRNDEYNRWDEEEIRRSRDLGSRYDEPRQYSQEYSSGQQYGGASDYRMDRDWQRRQRERLRRAAPDLDPQFQQESFSRPGTFYYGGEPLRHFGLGPAEPAFEGDSAPDEYGRQLARTPMTPMSYGGYGAGYGGPVDRARMDAAYRDMARFEQDLRYDDTPDRFHPDRERPRDYDQRPGMMERARNWFGHRGKGPKGYTRSDERIREDINDHLTQDYLVDATHIEVLVADCECTLNGTVTSRDQKRRAEDIAESIMGVKHVQNNLRVAPTSTSALSTQDPTGTMSTTIGSNPVLSASRSSSYSR